MPSRNWISLCYKIPYSNRMKERIFDCLFVCSLIYSHNVVHAFDLQVALKRQQAVEDAIAMRLVSNETGKQIDALPPGKIFGMSITEPCNAPSDSKATESLSLMPKIKNRKHLVLGYVSSHQIAWREIKINYVVEYMCSTVQCSCSHILFLFFSSSTIIATMFICLFTFDFSSSFRLLLVN